MARFGSLLLVALPSIVYAEPAFRVVGLHLDMGFKAAVAAAEKLGGSCEVGTHRRGEVTFARCEYSACTEDEAACPQGGTSVPTLGMAPVPVVRIGLEARDDSALLSRVAIVFDGDFDRVAQGLEQVYGAPADDTAVSSPDSWSNSRRLFWREGEFSMALLKRRQTIMLTTTRPEGPGENEKP